MKIEDMSPEQAYKYFQSRLPGATFRKQARGYEYRTQCPWDGDKTPSLQVNTKKKTFYCFECRRDGGLIEFEMELMGVDKTTALMRIGEVIGEKLLGFAAVEPDVVYDYTDETGKTLYQVLRYQKPGEKKRMGFRKPSPAGGWVYSLDDGGPVRRVLYRLREVLTRQYIVVTEGEKDADLVWGLLGDENRARLAVTTNAGGAGAWLDCYSPYLTGKDIVVLEDDDEPGRARTAHMGLSLWPYTTRIKRLADIGYHDIGDWIAAGGTEQELMEILRSAKQWTPPDYIDGFFVGADRLAGIASDKPDWIIEPLIERGANGILIAQPKLGKSLLALHLAMHLALGRDWLGFHIPSRVRVGYVAREDSPGLTARRLIRYGRAFGERQALDEFLYINTKRQTQKFALDDSAQLEELIQNVKIRKIEIVFLDVLNRLHGADENDNTQMRGVLDRIEYFTSEARCSVFLVHHTHKADDPDAAIVAGSRGASAIAGFAEFAARIDSTGYQSPVRRLRWESKSEAEIKPLYYELRNDPEQHSTTLEVVEYHDEERRSRETNRRSPGAR